MTEQEAAEMAVKEYAPGIDTDGQKVFKDGFLAGIKWERRQVVVKFLKSRLQETVEGADDMNYGHAWEGE